MTLPLIPVRIGGHDIDPRTGALVPDAEALEGALPVELVQLDSTRVLAHLLASGTFVDPLGVHYRDRAWLTLGSGVPIIDEGYMGWILTHPEKDGLHFLGVAPEEEVLEKPEPLVMRMMREGDELVRALERDPENADLRAELSEHIRWLEIVARISSDFLARRE